MARQRSSELGTSTFSANVPDNVADRLNDLSGNTLM
jgi:hypothetical protein